jgi:hypothetical protein
MDEGRWALRFWRWLPLLSLANAGFVLLFLSVPGNLVPAAVFLILGLGPVMVGKFVDTEWSGDG